MRRLSLVLAGLAGLALGGCSSTDEGFSELRSASGGFQRMDTYGTSRRMDVYSGATAPSLPSIGTPGLGK